ncbi:unnamed protein product [Phytomonas sp. EM1]|nr:unnamed protein product [Phytomonas sp. EM1]|eukprot:CCW65250.1 unnamed protein product [Phytomonas sp. isolate EM1]
MPQMTHIVRFKVISVECGALQDGQQYTIYYRRGDTRRSTPCYTARNGVVDFRMMPEGAAIIHFKNGGVSRRFAPKYILFRLEEYIIGVPRRMVCETNVDCSNVLGLYDNSGSGVIDAPIQIYGVGAKMKVAILVYPENGLPLSFDTIIKPQQPDQVEGPVGKVSVMSRGEAMTLLISLETMLERKRQADPEGAPITASKSELKVIELEEKRNKLARLEGMASKAVTVRCCDVVKAQFVALARKFRNNYVGATAAYLRQMALMSGIPLADKMAIQSENTMQEQLARTTSRIEDLRQQIHQLEQNQLALGRIQHKTDVTAELMANLEKVDSLNGQIKILEQTKEANEKALFSRDNSGTPLGREVKGINEHIEALEMEQEQLRAQVSHMVVTAAAHVLSWARSKNPPQPETNNKSTIDNLFSDAGVGSLGEGRVAKNVLVSNDPKPIVAPQRTQSSSSSDCRTPKDLFSGKDLPSMGDFKAAESKNVKTKESNTKPQYQDPLKPTGLNTEMFARSNSESAVPNSPVGPLVGDINTVVEPGLSINVLSEPTQAKSSDVPSANSDGHIDPYYDEMDYFTPPPNVDEPSNAAAAQLFSNFGFEGTIKDALSLEDATNVRSPLRPKFNFGPSDDAETTAVEANAATTLSDNHAIEFGKPTYDFAPSVDNTTQDNDSKVQDKKYSIPIYNFAS